MFTTRHRISALSVVALALVLLLTLAQPMTLALTLEPARALIQAPMLDLGLAPTLVLILGRTLAPAQALVPTPIPDQTQAQTPAATTPRARHQCSRLQLPARTPLNPRPEPTPIPTPAPTPTQTTTTVAPSTSPPMAPFPDQPDPADPTVLPDRQDHQDHHDSAQDPTGSKHDASKRLAGLLKQPGRSQRDEEVICFGNSYGSTVYVNLEGQTGQALGMALALGKAFFSIGMDLGLLFFEQLLRLFTTILDILPEWETLGSLLGDHWHWERTFGILWGCLFGILLGAQSVALEGSSV